MDLQLPTQDSGRYSSASQKIRNPSEDWTAANIGCPKCGKALERFANNRPVADLFCPHCSEQFELKSKRGTVGRSIMGGAYESMKKRLTSAENPNLFLLCYDARTMTVRDFVLVPRYFFRMEMIEKRKPLAATARRAGWVGCNIHLDMVPAAGRIYYVKNRAIVLVDRVRGTWSRTWFLNSFKDPLRRSWMLDLMGVLDELGTEEFTLSDVYEFEGTLQSKHPENKHVRDKIRQQLQTLRDHGFLQFLGGGKYRIG